MRRTIRKTFLLEGETVTMKYVKTAVRRRALQAHDRGREKEILRRPDRRPVLSWTPEGYLTIWFELA